MPKRSINQFFYKSLPVIEEFIENANISLSMGLQENIKNHCNALINGFYSYFPEKLNHKSRIRNPFALSNCNFYFFRPLKVNN